ncbi:MAG: ZIP family metal transporter, partial [Dehalococcoidia bacterium]|nr:ZIP family metal transporter [Dehalococcoidia bacterium]
MNEEIIWLGSVASLVAGLATGAGALPVLFTKKVSDKLLDVMLGFSAGVMLAATSFSLIIPAIDLSGVW